MRAIVHEGYGPPDVVRMAEVEKPTPRDTELLIKVHATTVNRTDCAFRGGTPFITRLFSGLFRPRAAVWGCEFAGEIEAVGSDVTSFAVGDRVFGYNDGPCGAHAEHMVVAAAGMVATIPSNVSYEQAAAATEGAHYAIALITKAAIRSGQDVLVYGASGGIGSAAVQLVKSHGAHVTAVCGPEHMALAESLGADKVVDYTAQDFTDDDQSYDVVIDAVGKSTFRRCKRLLKPGGIYMSSELGPYGQNPLLALVTPLLGGKKVHFPIPRQNAAMAQYLRGLMESGEFQPVIDDRHYGLDEITAAYIYVESGRKIGNVVINVA
jgi:NADPH:quinone reductase-like Zn-dependent oxidoreductase